MAVFENFWFNCFVYILVLFWRFFSNHASFVLGVEEFAQGLLDIRGPIVELEALENVNPEAYRRRIVKLQEAFSVFPGEVSLYFR